MQGNENIKLENENFFFKKLKNYCRENLTQILSIVTVVFVLATFVLFLFNKTMPVAEGWYSYYAYDMNENGAIP